MLSTQIDFLKLGQRYFTQQQLDSACIYVKDSKGTYRFHNNCCVQMLHALDCIGSSQASFVGASDQSLFGAKVAEPFLRHDEQVMSTGVALSVLESIPLAGYKKILESTIKIPLYIDGKLYGTLGKMVHMNLFFINNNNIILSQREMQVLAHIYFGFSADYISRKLNISSRTVETHFARIKHKFSVTRKIDLIKIINKPEFTWALSTLLH